MHNRKHVFPGFNIPAGEVQIDVVQIAFFMV